MFKASFQFEISFIEYYALKFWFIIHALHHMQQHCDIPDLQKNRNSRIQWIIFLFSFGR